MIDESKFCYHACAMFVTSNFDTIYIDMFVAYNKPVDTLESYNNIKLDFETEYKKKYNGFHRGCIITSLNLISSTGSHHER